MVVLPNQPTVYNSRTTEANAARQNQPTRSTGTAVTDPAAASLQRLRETQAYFAENPSALAEANKSAAYTGASDVQSQALAGQKLAESYVAPTNRNAEYYSQQAAQLQGATSTYANAANGFQSQINNSIDTDKNSPTYGQQIQSNVQMASQSGLEQSAIDNLRKNGKTDAEITSIMASPEFKNSIRTAMSNTGTGTGTARTSPVLTTAEAQNILATSRNPKQRAEAQSALDKQAETGISRTIERQVGIDKNGNPIYQTITNPNFDKELEAKKQRMAIEEQSRLKQQEAADKLKKFVAGVDTTPIDKTKTQIDALMSSISGLSPDLQAAVLPQLLAIQQSNNDIASQANEIRDALPTDKEIEGSYGTMESYILSQDAKFKEILSRNLETSKEIAQYNQDALKIEKQIIEHDAAIGEQKQIVANAEGEKQLRRQLNRLGIQTDISGLNYLQTEIQKGVTALEDLKKGNNLVSLKAQLAIGEGYRLEVKQAMEIYEGNYLNLTSQTTEKLQTIKNSINTAKSERGKSIIETKKWELEQKKELDKEARTTISAAYKDMITQQNTLRDDSRAQETLGWNVLDKAIDDYGVNIPKSILDRVGKMLPGVDLQDIAKAKTLAQMKKGGGGANGGVGTFSISQRTPKGKPISLEEFIAQKEASIKGKSPHKSSALAGIAAQSAILGSTPEQKKAWEKEYNAKLAAENETSSTQLMKEWKVKKAGQGNFSTLGGMQATEKDLMDAINSGDTALARNILDGIGPKAPEKTVAQVSSIERVINDLNDMESLLDRIEGNIGAFPTKGALWTWMNENIETTPEYGELRQLIDSNLAPYSRGISGDKGATTEPDVQRAMSSLLDPNADPDSVRAALVSAKKQAHQSVSIYLQNMRDSGYRVKAMQDSYSNNQYAPSTPPLDSAKKSWLDSF